MIHAEEQCPLAQLTQAASYRVLCVSQCTQHSKAAFASRLIAWAKASGMRAVVVLTGADAGQLIDAQLAGYGG